MITIEQELNSLYKDYYILLVTNLLGNKGEIIKCINTRASWTQIKKANGENHSFAASIDYCIKEGTMIPFSHKNYAREAIKADRENVAKHATVKDLIVPACDDHTPYWGACVSCGGYDNPDILIGSTIDKDSIINAPEIKLL